MEEIIWNKIINSAKSKFDYFSFYEQFTGIDNTELPDNILLMILVSFASGELKEKISRKISNELMKTGLLWKEEDIIKFLSDKDEVLELEIFATRIAGELLEDGEDSKEVLKSITQLLS